MIDSALSVTTVDIILWLTVFAAGLCVGSFLNVVIYRGPQSWGLVDRNEFDRGNLVGPRSYCPACHTPIPYFRLVPVVSFLLQGGKCAACGAPISIRYPIVELAAGVLAVAALHQYGYSLDAVFVAVCFWILLALAAIDLDTGYLPDVLTLPLMVLGIGFNAIGGPVTFVDSFIGAGAGYISFRLIAGIYLRLRSAEGLGLGDAKLLGAIGAWVGWQALPFVVFIGTIFTLALIILLMIKGSHIDQQTALPFGPGLCAGGALMLYLAATPIIVP